MDKLLLDKKILIVEDVLLSLKMVSNFLMKEGFTNLHEYTESAEAWEFFAESQLSDEPVDLVLTDLNMPGLDGMDLVRNIKSDEMTGDVKIIIISADHDPLIIDEAMEIGADEYITKPVQFDQLLEKIDYVFNTLPNLEQL
jgi:two-component system chemotaxis response regulator CheY